MRRCLDTDFDAIYTIINDAAQAYRGIIPEDRWREPYMPANQLRREIAAGVVFWGEEGNSALVGVMGLQEVKDVTLIRHAYVRTAEQRRGIGGALLSGLRKMTERPVLIGTWAAAVWAVKFYEKRDFRLVSRQEKDRLLKTYWSVPARQAETSVVLADRTWWAGKRA